MSPTPVRDRRIDILKFVAVLKSDVVKFGVTAADKIAQSSKST